MKKSDVSNFPGNKHQVEAILTANFKGKIAAAQEIDAVYADLLRSIAQLVGRGGKRMRPQLVSLAYRAYGGADAQAITRVAASQELFHAFLLMHDDIVDRDTTRWGNENINGRYRKKFLPQLGAEEATHFGNAWGLLAGDTCASLSNELLLTSDFPPEQLLRAVTFVQETLFKVIGGELLDVALPIFTNWDTPPNQEQLLRVCRYKTASYSFCTPLQLGALLAGADKIECAHLEEFGARLGIAFQLQDDILGMFGDKKKLGKSNLSDLREGKRTLLMTYGTQLAAPAQRQTLKRILGNSKATSAQLQTVQHILKISGALAKTEALMSDHCTKARAALLQCTLPDFARQELSGLITFCAERAY